MTTQTFDIDSRNLSDLWLLTNGGFDPFRGFHDFDDARSIVETVETVSGTLIFHCTRCGSMASSRTCSHEPGQRLTLSGTEVRRRLRDGEPLPAEITRPEMAAVLREAYASPGRLHA